LIWGAHAHAHFHQKAIISHRTTHNPSGGAPSAHIQKIKQTCIECGGMIHPINRTHTRIYTSFHAIWPRRGRFALCVLWCDFIFAQRPHMRRIWVKLKRRHMPPSLFWCILAMMESTISPLCPLIDPELLNGPRKCVVKIKVCEWARGESGFCRCGWKIQQHVRFENFCSISGGVRIDLHSSALSTFVITIPVYYSRSNNSVIDAEGYYTSWAHTPQLVMDLISLSSWIILWRRRRPTRPRAPPQLVRARDIKTDDNFAHGS
jgi:hypothetical protein